VRKAAAATLRFKGSDGTVRFPHCWASVIRHQRRRWLVWSALPKSNRNAEKFWSATFTSTEWLVKEGCGPEGGANGSGLGLHRLFQNRDNNDRFLKVKLTAYS